MLMSPMFPAQNTIVKWIWYPCPDSMRMILCPEITAVDAEHTLTHTTCFICPQNVM
jgi:hypothetical protein